MYGTMRPVAGFSVREGSGGNRPLRKRGSHLAGRSWAVVAAARYSDSRGIIMSGMTEKQKDDLASLGGRLEVHRKRVKLPRAVDEDVEIARAIVSTLVLFTDHGKVPEALQHAIAHQIKAVRRGRRWSDPVEVVR